MNLARITGWIERAPVFKQTNGGLIAQFDLLVTEGEGDAAYEMEIPVYAVQSEIAEILKSLWSEPLEVTVEGKLGAFSKALKGTDEEYIALKVVLSDPAAHSVKALTVEESHEKSPEVVAPPTPVAQPQPSAVPDPVENSAEAPHRDEGQNAAGNGSTASHPAGGSAAQAEVKAAVVRPAPRGGAPGFGPPVTRAPSSRPAGGGLRSLGGEGGLRNNHPSGPLPDHPPERSSRLTIGEQLKGRGGVGRVSDLVVGYATGAQAMDRAGRPAMPDVNDEIPW